MPAPLVAAAPRRLGTLALVGTMTAPDYAAPLCRAHPDDCPNGPGPHAYYNPPELEGRCPCCRQPGEPETPPGELLEELF